MKRLVCDVCCCLLVPLWLRSCWELACPLSGCFCVSAVLALLSLLHLGYHTCRVRTFLTGVGNSQLRSNNGHESCKTGNKVHPNPVRIPF
jgi:hypothetical protein